MNTDVGCGGCRNFSFSLLSFLFCVKLYVHFKPVVFLSFFSTLSGNFNDVKHVLFRCQLTSLTFSVLTLFTWSIIYFTLCWNSRSVWFGIFDIYLYNYCNENNLWHVGVVTENIFCWKWIEVYVLIVTFL